MRHGKVDSRHGFIFIHSTMLNKWFRMGYTIQRHHVMDGLLQIAKKIKQIKHIKLKLFSVKAFINVQ